MPHQVWPHKTFTRPLMPINASQKTAAEPSYILHWSALSLNQLILKKDGQILANSSGEISCNLIVHLDQHSKAPHPKTFIRVAKKTKHTKTTS